MEFIKFILIVVLSYYLIKIIIRLLFPFILAWFVKKTMNRFVGNNFAGMGNESNYEDVDSGGVKIKGKGNNSKTSGYDATGEYVDFEEIKD